MNSQTQRTYGFTAPIQNASESIIYASENNLKHVELNFTKNFLNGEFLNKSFIDEVNKLSYERSIGISFHLPFNENISDNIPLIRKKSIKRLKGFIEAAGLFKGSTVTVHPGMFYWFPLTARKRIQALERLASSLKEILEVCKKVGTKIVLENLVQIPQGSDYYFLGDNINDFKTIFGELNSEYLGFCLDTGHANMNEGVGEYIEQLSDKLSVIHYHDNLGSNDNHLVIGEGNINWSNVCGKLLDVGFQGPIISECRNIQPHAAAEIFEKHFNLVEQL